MPGRRTPESSWTAAAGAAGVAGGGIFEELLSISAVLIIKTLISKV
jgi:hypothetical protein